MVIRSLPLFDGFIETPFERRFQRLLRQAWLPQKLACHCGRAGLRQNDGHWRPQR
jgi:hypothetical protein